MYIPKIQGVNPQDLRIITSAVMESLDSLSRDYDFVDDYARIVSERRFNNENFDALVEVAFDVVDEANAWGREAKYIDKAVMLFSAICAMDNRNYIDLYPDDELDIIEDLVEEANRGRGGRSRRSRNDSAYGSGRRGNSRRQPYGSQRGSRFQSVGGFRDSSYNGGRSMCDDPDEVSVRLDSGRTRPQRQQPSRQQPRDTRRDQFEGRVEQDNTPPVRQQPRDNYWGNREPIYTNEKRSNQPPARQPMNNSVPDYTKPSTLPTRKEVPMAVTGSHTQRGKVNLVHQFADGAKSRINQLRAPLISPWGTHVFFEEGTSGFDGIYVVPEEEIHVDKKLHQVERFFRDWVGDTSPDKNKTDATIKSLQDKITIETLERELDEKFGGENTSFTDLPEQYSASKLITLPGKDLIVGFRELTAADARMMFESSVAEDGMLAKVDQSNVNFAYRTYRMSPWAISGKPKEIFLSLKDKKNYGEVREWLIELMNAGLPKEVTRDINEKLTKWINQLMHRVFGNHSHVIDSFLGDIAELETILDQFNVSEVMWNKSLQLMKSAVLRVVEVTEEVAKEFNIEAPLGSAVLMEPIDVTRIGLDSTEVALSVSQNGTALVSTQSYPELAKALAAVTSALDGETFESVIITNDGDRMYVTRTSAQTFYLTRV